MATTEATTLQTKLNAKSNGEDEIASSGDDVDLNNKASQQENITAEENLDDKDSGKKTVVSTQLNATK